MGGGSLPFVVITTIGGLVLLFRRFISSAARTTVVLLGLAYFAYGLSMPLYWA